MNLNVILMLKSLFFNFKILNFALADPFGTAAPLVLENPPLQSHKNYKFF